jgi:membrane protein implicated in regulation of membrane protease activity
MFNERITVYWLIAAVILVVLEMFVGTFYLLVIAAALASVGLTEWLFATGMEFNLALLGVLCLGGIFLARRYQKRRASDHVQVNLPLDINQAVKIEQHLHDNVYQVHYRGTVWQAQLQDTQNINIGQTAYISARQGNVLLIRSTL